jgi:hypothetical protein
MIDKQHSAKRRTVAAILVFLALISLVWIRQRAAARKFKNSDHEPVAAATTNSRQSHDSSDSNAMPPGSQATVPPQLSRTNQAFTGSNGKNVPINFWGRVVDQDEEPLSGVKVKATIRSWHGFGPLFPEGHFAAEQSVTDKDGRFEIRGGRGDVLTIKELAKSGYESEGIALRSFGYNISTNINPDPNRPVVLRMWRKGMQQPVITGDKSFSITPDARVYTLDLTKGTSTESSTLDGDLRIWIKRLGSPGFGQRYHWSFGIEAIDGGVLEEVDPYSSMFLAPEAGYSKSLESGRLASERNWGHTADKKIYLKSKGGRSYGRIEINIYAQYGNETGARIFVRYVINPTGSRILR